MEIPLANIKNPLSEVSMSIRYENDTRPQVSHVWGKTGDSWREREGALITKNCGISRDAHAFATGTIRMGLGVTRYIANT